MIEIKVSSRTEQRRRAANGTGRLAGRPRVLESAKRVTIVMSAAEQTICSELGRGNVSAGVRVALAFYVQHSRIIKIITNK